MAGATAPAITQNQPAATTSGYAPTYLSSAFPQGLPQSAGAAPVTAPGQAQTSQVQAPTINGAAYTPEALQAQILAALGPQFAQQQQALAVQQGAAGITGGSTAGAEALLGGQQSAQAAGAIAPYEQQDQSLQAQIATQNANNALAASGANASNQLSSSELLQQQILAAAQGNQSATQENNQFNTNNALTAGQNNVNAANTLQSQILGLNNQDWLAKLNLQGTLAQNAASGQTSAFQPVNTQPGATPNFGSVVSAFNAPNTPTGQTATTSYNPYQSSDDPYAPGNNP